MIALYIAKKNFIEFFRRIKSNLIVIIMPVVFFAVFGFIFTKSTSNITFSMSYISDNNQQYQALLESLRALDQSDGKAKPFDLVEANNLDEAKKAINNSGSVLILAPQSEKGITLYGDNRSPYFAAAAGIITEVAGNVYQVDLSLIKRESLNESSERQLSGFDLLVPGLVVYGLLILIPYNAAVLTLVTEKKQILRYYLSKASASDIILGFIISQTVLCLFQTILMFITAQLFGFKTNAQLWEILVITLPTNLFITGTGMLLGSFTKNSESASNLGSIVSVLLGFLSGSFIVGIETIMQIGNFWGRNLSLNQIFPSTLATQAFNQLLNYDRHLGDVMFELTGISVISTLILLIGIYVYNKKHLSNID